MADAGRSLHPSARGRGGTERRRLRLLRLLLWVGTAFQVTQGAERELHACKEVLSSRNRPHFGQKNLGSWWRPWGPKHRVSEATEFRFGGMKMGGGSERSRLAHGEASALGGSQSRQGARGGRSTIWDWAPGLRTPGRRHELFSSWGE